MGMNTEILNEIITKQIQEPIKIVYYNRIQEWFDTPLFIPPFTYTYLTTHKCT